MSLKDLEKRQEILKKQIYEKKRSDIIDIAEKMFRKFEIEKTSVDKIAQVAGISKGTLYNHYFNRKEDILLEIAIRAYKKLISMFEEGIQAHQPGIEQVSEMGRKYYEFASNYRIYRQTFDIAGQLSNLDTLRGKKTPEIIKRSEDIVERLQIQQQKFVKIWAATVKRAQDLGEITDKYNAVQVAFILGTISTGLADELMTRENWAQGIGLTIKQVLEIAIEFLTDGIRKRN